MNTKHTPEPWEAHGATIQTPEGYFLFVSVNSTLNGAKISDEEQEANATRIVACVNACAGFYYPEELIRWMKSIKVNVESDTIDVSVILKELEEAKRQRDELLKELQELKSKL